jgi:hypothetical protein
MKDMQITAKSNAGKPDEKVGSIVVKAPENLDEAREMFGPDPILSNAMANWVVTLQSSIRSGLKKGEDDTALQARLGGAKMGVAAQKASVDPIAALRSVWQQASPEEKQAIMKQLEAGQAGEVAPAAPAKPKK